MRVAINKKYKYITPENVPDIAGEFEEWVMDEKYQTHSIVEVDNSIDVEKLRFIHFDYDEKTDVFSFNVDKFNADLEKMNQKYPTELEYLLDLDYRLSKIELGL